MLSTTLPAVGFLLADPGEPLPGVKVRTEECGRYGECTDYTNVFGNHVVAIEYRDADFRKACAAIGSSAAVVRRDRNVTTPGSPTYRFATC